MTNPIRKLDMSEIEHYTNLCEYFKEEPIHLFTDYRWMQHYDYLKRSYHEQQESNKIAAIVKGVNEKRRKKDLAKANDSKG